MGVRTGKVLDFSPRNKNCETCSDDTRLGKVPKKHGCRKNFSGSANAMESSVAVELFKRAAEKNVRYSMLIGDDDKWSDVQHAKRTLRSHLYETKGKHKELSEKVIKASCKNFAYALRQNANKPDELDKALRNIPNHMFGKHENCSPDYIHTMHRKSVKSFLKRSLLSEL